MMNIAVVTSPGFGDGLIMMNASETLRLAGHNVVTFNDHLPALRNWFPGHNFAPQPKDKSALENFDLIVMQHDNSKKSQMIIESCRKKLAIFYPSYDANRHPPLQERDRVATSRLPLSGEISRLTADVFDCAPCKSNGITPPPHLVRHKHRNRVIIHPTSSTPLRTWPLEKFVDVAEWVASRGFQPTFVLSPKERAQLGDQIPSHLSVPPIATLEETANLIFESHYVIGNESGIVHLASNLDIPFLVIAGNKKRIQQWQPGWRKGRIVTPRRYVPNIKGLRLRENQWKRFITPHRIIKALLKSPQIAL